MSITFQNPITRYPNTHISFNFKTHIPKSPNFNLTIFPQTLKLPKHNHSSIKALQSNEKQSFDLDDILSISEFLCLASSTILSIGFVVNATLSSSQKAVFEWCGMNKVIVWQPVLLIVGIVIGVVIRKRQWRRVCLGFSKPGSGSSSVNFVDRIEKVEQDVRNSATIIRVLSRQLEKLGIRFRVTRKSMKEPIAQTAELAQKNSEATRALAMQEDNLEKELGEIQKVLLAMQDQQQKQLELILAIAKSGKLLDNKPVPVPDQKKSQTSNLSGSGSKSDGHR